LRRIRRRHDAPQDSLPPAPFLQLSLDHQPLERAFRVLVRVGAVPVPLVLFPFTRLPRPQVPGSGAARFDAATAEDLTGQLIVVTVEQRAHAQHPDVAVNPLGLGGIG
jgi:hypothetical protein